MLRCFWQGKRNTNENSNRSNGRRHLLVSSKEQNILLLRSRITRPPSAQERGRKSTSLRDEHDFLQNERSPNRVFSCDNTCATSGDSQTNSLSATTTPPTAVPLWQKRSEDHQREEEKEQLNRDSHPAVDSQDDDSIESLEQKLRKFERPKNLPRVGKFSNNHVLVNSDRCFHNLPAVVRLRALDSIARVHAKQMALKGCLFHVNLDTINEVLHQQEDLPIIRRLGANVGSGHSVMRIHLNMIDTQSGRRNILDSEFTHMGMGTARGLDGKMYLCQIFLG